MTSYVRSIRSQRVVWFANWSRVSSVIPAHPRLGVRLREFDPREVRKILIGDYEVRYTVLDADVFVLRIFHTREDR